MDNFSDYKKYFKIDIPGVLKKTIDTPENRKRIIDYNQKEQLSEGIDALEQRIETISSKEQRSGFPYARYTVAARSQAGLQVKKVDLKFHGDFWKTFEVKVNTEQTEVLADFSKGAEDIRDNFDSKYQFLGITKNNLENFAWDIFEQFAENLRKSAQFL